MSFRKVWMKARANDPVVLEHARLLYRYLTDRGLDVYVDPLLGHVIPGRSLSELEAREADLGIVVGGDGTLLRTVQKSNAVLPPILGFSSDSLGYLLPHRVDVAREVLEEVLRGNYSERDVALGEFIAGERAGVFLNEVCVWSEPGKIVEFEVLLNDESLYRVRGDGVIVATPAGSTGHAFSYGGPVIIDTGQRALEVVFPGALSPLIRPLIVHGGSIAVKVIAHPANLVVDGQVYSKLQEASKVTVRPSSKSLRFIYVEKYETPLPEKLARRVLDRGLSYVVSSLFKQTPKP
ncbi:NAD(+)/NADH kinase [Thermofilum pendens]|uniref:NAD kinase n=1 Tax=Thermofilum pendens (strain DSM 2475 / Hrk 5) TaxID=368408 RepID=A1RXJ9_THEPD|nr:NAD(+)/NADH kinase [Thermofilum pendens]ABL77929.1 NAD(+) kinase [Thermofilum pendens Hrk 5]